MASSNKGFPIDAVPLHVYHRSPRTPLWGILVLGPQARLPDEAHLAQCQSPERSEKNSPPTPVSKGLTWKWHRPVLLTQG